jgi:dimethylargininase
MHHKAILRPPSKTFSAGITTAGLGKPDYEKAMEQHRSCGEALERCGLELIWLDADERFPDACFVDSIGKHTFVAIDEFAERFGSGQLIWVEAEEAYTANCLLVNGTVLAPAGFPKVKQKISQLGYPLIEVDMSEFQKMDGGLTCLSLVF